MKIDEKVEYYLKESTSRYCAFYKAKDKKWYMELSDREYSEYDEAYTYGPFDSEEDAEEFLDSNFSNPGGYFTDRSGKKPVPKKSPNGSNVITPKKRWGRW